MIWPANSSCFPWNNASQQGFTPKAKRVPADGMGTEYGPRCLPHGFPQDIHTFPKAACTYADSEDNSPCKKGPRQLWSLMVSHVVLKHRSGYRDSENSHSWPPLRDFGIVECILPPQDCRLTSTPSTNQKRCTRSSLQSGSSGFL